jgi:6-phosphogluconolactonase
VKDFHSIITSVITDMVENSSISKLDIKSLMLTGGSTAKSLYKYWSINPPVFLSNNWYLFGDERCVPPSHTDSNYGMLVSALFPKGVPINCKIERIKGEATNCLSEAERYSKILPSSVDILLLSVGSDGHVASLFPGSEVIDEMKSSVALVHSLELTSKRVTITPKVIKSAKNIIVMAAGKNKGEILAKALKNPHNTTKFPVCLTIGSTWILDKDAIKSFNSFNLKNYYHTKVYHA